MGNVEDDAITTSGPLRIYRTVRDREALVVPWGGALALTKNIDPTNVADLTWRKSPAAKKFHEVMREHCKTHPGLEKAFHLSDCTPVGYHGKPPLIRTPGADPG